MAQKFDFLNLIEVIVRSPRVRGTQHVAFAFTSSHCILVIMCTTRRPIEQTQHLNEYLRHILQLLSTWTMAKPCLTSLSSSSTHSLPEPPSSHPHAPFIDSPLDWAFAPDYTRGLVCPSLRYGCCSDLVTWHHSSPCEVPEATTDSEHGYEQKLRACCQVEVGELSYNTEIPPDSGWDTFPCTTDFQKDGKAEQYGWRPGTKDKYFEIGKGALMADEKQAQGRSM
ncbi:hypothetical protein E8E12_006570 [Didymella heteroderae]|uniref:Uncharacterized protein n=1 Tax=Didymella heteroderae TaxID=1769908 RepID=A0A9P4WSK4_9PLEO|nr:hypothetical protein E8E12_006570 [Didymella heteroderae]